MFFLARTTREGSATLAEFPDCPGCQTFARPPRTIDAQAAEALHGWIEATLDGGGLVPQPRGKLDLGRGEHALPVPVDPGLAVRIALRWARDDAKLSQATVATRMGVTAQAVSRVERNAGAASIATLARYAASVGGRLEVRIEMAKPNAARPVRPARVSEGSATGYGKRARR